MAMEVFAPGERGGSGRGGGGFWGTWRTLVCAPGLGLLRSMCLAMTVKEGS